MMTNHAKPSDRWSLGSRGSQLLVYAIVKIFNVKIFKFCAQENLMKIDERQIFNRVSRDKMAGRGLVAKGGRALCENLGPNFLRV